MMKAIQTVLARATRDRVSFLAGAVAMFLLACGVVCVNTRAAQAADFPHIESQRSTPAGTRMLTISNPVRKPLWLYIECENVLTIHPIGVDGRRVVKVEMKDPSGPITTDCYLHAWLVQGGGSPEPWNP